MSEYAFSLAFSEMFWSENCLVFLKEAFKEVESLYPFVNQEITWKWINATCDLDFGIEENQFA